MRLAELVRAIVKAIIEPRLVLSALYPAAIARQEASGVCDVLPDSPELRGTGAQGVPYYVGLPGWTAQVPAGVRCLLGYGAARPTGASVTAWASGSAVDKLVFDGGSESVARTQDTVNTGELYWQTGANILYWRLLPGSPWAPVISGALAPTPLTPGLPTMGLISSGNPKLLA